MKKNEERAPHEKRGRKDSKLVESQMKREAGDRNRTQTSSRGKVEVTALNDPPVHRQTRSMPRTSKAVIDALTKKPRDTSRDDGSNEKPA